MLSGAHVQEIPACIAGVDVAREDEDVLVAITGVPRETIDAEWFAGIGAAIERFDRVRAILPSTTDTKIATFTAAARRRWFRSAKPLTAYA